MAGSLQPLSSNPSRRAPMAEINVTPFVDVMLVLLIVFMVTAPLLTVGVAVDLPETQAKALPAGQDPLTISITKDGSVFIAETRIEKSELIAKLEAISNANKELGVYVRADKDTAFGDWLEVVAMIDAAGFKRLRLPSKPLSSSSK